MRLLISSLLLLVPVLLFGQEAGIEQKLEIREIPGLNTRISHSQQRELGVQLLNNADMSRSLGDVSKRRGYDYVSTLSNAGAGVDVDSMWIYGAKFSDGESRLVVVGAIADSGYGAVWVSSANSACLNSSDSVTRVYDCISIITPPTFAIYDDIIFITNGMSRGVTWKRGLSTAIQFPPRAPGEIDVVPLNSSCNLDGEYSYQVEAIFYDSSGDATTNYRYRATAPVLSRGNAVLLSGFDTPPHDSIYDFDDTIDSIWLVIRRTEALTGGLQTASLVYIADTLGYGLGWDTTDVIAATFTDTISDTALVHNNNDIAESAETGLPVRIANDLFNEFNGYGYQFDGDILPYYCAPGYFSGLPVGATTDSIFLGWKADSDTLGFSYAVSFVDTILGIESRLSAPLHVWNDGSTAHRYNIVLPTPYGRGVGMRRWVYRAPIIKYSYDSTYIAYWETNEINTGTYYWDCSCAGCLDCFRDCRTIENFETFECYSICCEQVERIIIEQIPVYETIHIAGDIYTEQYKRIANMSASDTMFIDSVRQALVYDNPVTFPYYEGTGMPQRINYLMTHQNRLFASSKSTLYWSSAFSPGSWGAFFNTEISKNDGQVITGIWPTRLAVKVAKSGSKFSVFPGSDDITFGDWAVNELSSHNGCIAPASVAKALGGIYYLSEVGVMFESEGATLERTYKDNMVSIKIDNISKLSASAQRDAIGFYHDSKYLLRIGDTVYVYDELVDKWGTWTNMKFNSVTSYGVPSQSVGFIPNDSMYFSIDSNLYRYGSTEYDITYSGANDSAEVNFIFTIGPVLVDDTRKTITKMGVWCNTSSSTDTIAVIMYDENQNLDLWVGSQKFSNTHLRGRVLAVQSSPNKGFYFTVGARNGKAKTEFEGLDIYYIIQGSVEVEK